MYYTADTNINNPGSNNAIGIALSNDGRTWTDQPQPVLEPESGFNGGYGAGMSGLAWDGSWLIHAYLDSTVQPLLRIRQSLDGFNFSDPSNATQLHAAGRQGNDGQGPDIAFNEFDQHWYAVIKNHDPMGNYDGETRVLRSMNPNDLYGAWEVIGIFNSSTTGFPQNHNPGLAKNQDGTLYTDSEGWHYVFLTVGNLLPDWMSWQVAQGRFREICSIAIP